MTEGRVAFLYKISSNTFSTQNNTGNLLRSYYLMRCHDLTKSYGLPGKQFSPLARCSFCCTKWETGNHEIEVRPVKLSKGQRRRIRKANKAHHSKQTVKTEKAVLRTNLLERRCLLCKHVTEIPLEKPDRTVKKTKPIVTEIKTQVTNIKVNEEKNLNNLKDLKVQKGIKHKPEINVYSNTNDVFSLANKQNDIVTKLPEKVIKNNKKKKDKFAGLRMEAVLAAAKMATTKDSQKLNKLNLFLKPSKLI